MSTRERDLRLRAYRLKHKLCTRCGGKRTNKTHLSCGPCRAKERAFDAKFRRAEDERREAIKQADLDDLPINHYFNSTVGVLPALGMIEKWMRE